MVKIEVIKKKEPVKKQWIFGEFLDDGKVDFIFDTLLTEEEFINEQYDADSKYFRIDPKLIEKIKVETKIVKEV